ncbi:LysR family transcriptional regulator [Xylophilus rhododendri]|uniref:LysR family transcriptional regulator n=1 Tax=Xylophilus rhododendri TaxID=2697032 RepID=A0A857J6V9_9BURK|nr:LysR family transcriptional regulator [Xylophilus rhododendri]QHI98771.1 LysR family transcriptional regulator [Xylophilus rhododendri]
MSELNFRSFDLNLLRVFDEVMAERSLTRAAHNLSLTQPAVSNALRRLRDSLGDELVRRHGQGMEPTPRALAIWPGVREALRQMQRSLSPQSFSPATADQSFTLSMADATATVLMPGLVQILETEAPGVQLRALPLSTRDPRQLLADENADLAVGYFPAVLADLTARSQAGEDQTYAFQRLYHGEYVCVMRQGHPLSLLSDAEFTTERFCAARHMLVSFSGRPYGFIDEALALLNRQRRVTVTVNQFFTAGRVVAQSDLLTVLPRHFVGATGLADRIVWRPLPFPVPTVHVDALWHRRHQNSAAHEWLRNSVTRAAELAGPMA